MVEISKLLRKNKKRDKDRVNKKNRKDINKRNYLNKVRDIQNKELNSLKYKSIKEFIDKYDNRNFLEEEKEMLEMLLGYHIYCSSDCYEKAHDDYAEKFRQLNSFINSLSDEQIDSNIYFSIAKKCFDESIVDCNRILLLLRKHMNHTDIFEEWKQISFKIFLSGDRLSYLLNKVNEEVSISVRRLKKSRVVDVPILNQENIHYYYKYNKIVDVVNKMCENICRLQMWNCLSKCSEEIDNYYFKIENNEFQKAFSVGFYVRIKKEELNVDNLITSLDKVVDSKEVYSDYSYKQSNSNNMFINCRREVIRGSKLVKARVKKKQKIINKNI